MKVKIIWLIGGLVFFILIWQIIITTNVISRAKTGLAKKIAGMEINLPQPDKNALVRPPEKSSGAGDPQIAAKAVILTDVSSAYVMYAKNADEKMPIASTTKIMTAMVVLDDFSDKLNDVVNITYPMIAVEGSDIKLVPGEKITVNNLLKGLLIMSGNDTATALAIYFGAAQSGSAPAGGQDAFVAKMNSKAKELCLENTHFADPAGLDDAGYSTPHDLAILASYALRHQGFREIVKISETTISSIDGSIIHDLKSSNRLVKSDDPFFYPSAIGIKTGFTYAAGHCLVSAAARDGHEILGVVLNTNQNSITASAAESRKLLDWGFSNWRWQ
jgi:D-alanyl-D-alanine carboxypeptidase